MNDKYLVVEGEIISTKNLKISKAHEVVKAIEESSYAQLIECRRTSEGIEIVILDVEVELGQWKTYNIERFERLAIKFNLADALAPEILALRSDFPRVPHLNIREEELPRSLCVFEQDYSDLKLLWTGPFFVERIREWLALTAKGKLHADDQPLEPLLPDLGWQLVLPSDLFTKGLGGDILTISDMIDSGNNRKTLITRRATNLASQKDPIKYIAILIRCEPQPHGIIYSVPSNILELHEFLKNGNVDLLSYLRQNLRQCDTNNANLMKMGVILIVGLPKTRGNGNTLPEGLEIRAFMIDKPIKEIGADIGIWSVVDSTVGVGKLVGIDETKNGQHLTVILLNPLFSFSRDMATQLSGLSSERQRKMALVGVGALGSQVFMNLIRMGYGEWTLIDKDFLLPHNLGRHALSAISVGKPKASDLALTANFMMPDDGPVAEGVTIDILKPDDPEKIKSAFNNTEIILDASTSIAVARHLACDLDFPARRISLFLNPLGTDVVILAEDEKREFTLDLLEMQYYRYLISEPTFQNHLQQNQGRLRYANSCRDISISIPQDLIALHAAICSRALRKIVAAEDAVISIWRTEDEENSVQKYLVPVANPIKFKKDEWLLCTDYWLIDKIYETRAAKLPNETGGILIGTYDMQRKIVYIVDTILSPPDSQEWPTVYIRGYRGLRQSLDRIKAVTMDNLQYVGEWHSHPQGYGCNPSKDDQQAFNWLTNVMGADGLPSLMLIAGDQRQYEFFLCQMNPTP